MPIAEDEKFMRLALKEARRGWGRTHPNPTVGAVVVKNGRVLGSGWHHGAGLPHAEIEALRSLSAKPRGATVYITLEPCSTQGRTPPCTGALREAGVARVVYGAMDPNPRHAGRADRILTEAGIRVTSGILATECAALNTHWNHWIGTGLPYVIAKAALTLDGRINSHPESRWISNEGSRVDAMRLRGSVQAILVGGETVRTDNPRLTIRGSRAGKQPWRIVWSRSAKLPADCHLLADEHRDRTLVLSQRSLRGVLTELGRLGVASVLVEGGGQVLGQAFRSGLVNEVCFYLAPLLTGGPTRTLGVAPAWPMTISEPFYRQIGDDVRLMGKVVGRRKN